MSLIPVDDEEEEEFCPDAGLKFVHPAIVELYLALLKMNDIGEIIDGYRLSAMDLPEEIKTNVEICANQFQIMKGQALNVLGSYYAIDRQINNFHNKTGDA